MLGLFTAVCNVTLRSQSCSWHRTTAVDAQSCARCDSLLPCNRHWLHLLAARPSAESDAQCYNDAGTVPTPAPSTSAPVPSQSAAAPVPTPTGFVCFHTTYCIAGQLAVWYILLACLCLSAALTNSVLSCHSEAAKASDHMVHASVQSCRRHHADTCSLHRDTSAISIISSSSPSANRSFSPSHAGRMVN